MAAQLPGISTTPQFCIVHKPDEDVLCAIIKVINEDVTSSVYLSGCYARQGQKP